MNLHDGSDSFQRRTAWKALSTLSGILAGVLTRKLLDAAWNAVRKDSVQDPPLNPADRRISWADALAWAVSAGIGVGVGRLLAERAAAAGWEAATGSPPPGIKD